MCVFSVCVCVYLLNCVCVCVSVRHRVFNIRCYPNPAARGLLDRKIPGEQHLRSSNGTKTKKHDDKNDQKKGKKNEKTNTRKDTIDTISIR